MLRVQPLEAALRRFTAEVRPRLAQPEA